jgi:superfamily II DNA or RNA helicase
MNYEQIIQRKSASSLFDGVEPRALGGFLFPHQKDLTAWALRKGRAAIFADTGLGKTAMELSWASEVATQKGRVLILAPLAVAEQIVREGLKFGIAAKYLREDDQRSPIVITNYEMLSHFDASRFSGVVLDESSILKNFAVRTRDELIKTFAKTPYRLAATATPAPNDFTELGNHSEFLGIKSHVEMLAEYFVHDGATTQEWRLKGHAENSFWAWVCSWGAVVKTPADLGHDGSRFLLPPLNMREVIVESNSAAERNLLFAASSTNLNEQRRDRKATIEPRVAVAAKIAAQHNEPLIIWGELNDECDLAEATIPGAVQVKGSDSPEEKCARLEAFSQGRIKTLVTKSSIAGFGMNWQHCNRMIFLGASHSYEMVYQAIRRCWRFGQTRPVEVVIIRADTDEAIVANYRRKEADAARFGVTMSSFVKELVRAEVAGSTAREWNDYNPQQEMRIPAWLRGEVLK